MRRFLSIMRDIIVDSFNSFFMFLERNLLNFARIVEVALPFVMYYIGQRAMAYRGEITIGYEVIIPIIAIVFIYVFRAYSNKIGKGLDVPVPEKRFTEVDDYGEVSIDKNRIQELILYVADLEDWLRRKGISKK